MILPSGIGPNDPNLAAGLGGGDGAGGVVVVQRYECDATGAVWVLSEERGRGGMPWKWSKGPAWLNKPGFRGMAAITQGYSAEGVGVVVRRENVDRYRALRSDYEVGLVFIASGDEDLALVGRVLVDAFEREAKCLIEH